ATPDIHATDNLPLAIQFPLDSEFQLARKLHVIEHVEKRFLGWKSDRWYCVPCERVRVRRVQIHWDLQTRRYRKNPWFFKAVRRPCAGRDHRISRVFSGQTARDPGCV